MSMIDLAERGFLPDFLIRAGIRRLLRQRLAIRNTTDSEGFRDSQQSFVAVLKDSPIAIATSTANQQHYEVPTDFFQTALGPHLKYSCCYFPKADSTLAEAETEMLRLTCERAEIQDGMDILELGCGWGSLSLWMAEHFPDARIHAVSNSETQREYILGQCRERGLENLHVETADMRDFDTADRFDRVVSVEMFEHMRNYRMLHERIASWLRPTGKLFVHIFCHRDFAYEFETEGDANWMGRHFFTGGIMPSDDLLLHFQDQMSLQRRWSVNGRQYARTCEAWLDNVDGGRCELLQIFAASDSPDPPAVMLQRWRMFFMACAELFRYHGGAEWYVSHYLFERNPANAQPARRSDSRSFCAAISQ